MTTTTITTAPDSTLPPSYNSTPLFTQCHCSTIKLILPFPPTKINECQCSICYRYGALWAYYPRNQVLVTAEADVDANAGAGTSASTSASAGGTETYLWGNRDIEFRRCTHCGCVTHWWATEKGDKSPSATMGVNMRMAEREVLNGVEWVKGKGPD